MGNSQPQQKFDPKLMEEHRKKMQSLQGQYRFHQLQAPGAYHAHKVENKSVNMTGIKRQTYLFKPSIDIDLLPNTQQINIHYDYHSIKQCNLSIFLGVKNIKGHSENSQPHEVDCLWKISEMLPATNKKHEQKIYNVSSDVINQLTSTGMIFRISSDVESSDYYTSYMKNTKIWKVLMETFQKGGKNYGIEDIYGGGEEGQECIICFTEPSTTMVKPCNHLCLCQECAAAMAVRSDNCPICRKKILELVTLNKT